MSTTLPLVAVDVGNSRYKFGLFPRTTDRQSLSHAERLLDFPCDTESLDEVADWLDDPPEAYRWRIASVNTPASDRFTGWLAAAANNLDLRILTPVDLECNAPTDQPMRIGIDRLMACVAADRLREPNHPAIVIDAGSAVTIDLISGSGDFSGGAILPGLAMAAGALNRSTDQLPLVDATLLSAEDVVLGRSTHEAISSGLYWGSVGAIREIVSRFSMLLKPEPSIFLTGGNAPTLSAGLGPTFKLTPHMVLRGIAARSM